MLALVRFISVVFNHSLIDRHHTRFWSSHFLLPTNLGICVSHRDIAEIYVFHEIGTSLVGIQSSLNLFESALKSVLASPVSFFDTTPLGRILSRLSKDQDTLDTILPLTMMQVRIALRLYTCDFLTM